MAELDLESRVAVLNQRLGSTQRVMFAMAAAIIALAVVLGVVATRKPTTTKQLDIDLVNAIAMTLYAMKSPPRPSGLAEDSGPQKWDDEQMAFRGKFVDGVRATYEATTTRRR